MLKLVRGPGGSPAPRKLLPSLTTKARAAATWTAPRRGCGGETRKSRPLSSGRPFSGRESPTLAASGSELLSSIGLIPPYRSRHAEVSLADSRLITPPNGGSSRYFTTPSFKACMPRSVCRYQGRREGRSPASHVKGASGSRSRLLPSVTGRSGVARATPDLLTWPASQLDFGSRWNRRGMYHRKARPNAVRLHTHTQEGTRTPSHEGYAGEQAACDPC